MVRTGARVLAAACCAVLVPALTDVPAPRGAVDPLGARPLLTSYVGPPTVAAPGGWPVDRQGSDELPITLGDAQRSAGARGPAVPARGDLPPPALHAYRAAANQLHASNESCGLHWSLLAAIGKVESDHGRYAGGTLRRDGTASPSIYGPRLTKISDTDGGRLDGDSSYDRAVGPMQFIPGTWRGYGRDGNGDGRADPQNVFDAALAAGEYLCADGSDLAGDPGPAVYRYNHSWSYVASVLALAAAYRNGVDVERTSWPDTGVPVDNHREGRQQAGQRPAGGKPPSEGKPSRPSDEPSPSRPSPTRPSPTDSDAADPSPSLPTRSASPSTSPSGSPTPTGDTPTTGLPTPSESPPSTATPTPSESSSSTASPSTASPTPSDGTPSTASPTARSPEPSSPTPGEPCPEQSQSPSPTPSPTSTSTACPTPDGEPADGTAERAQGRALSTALAPAPDLSPTGTGSPTPCATQSGSPTPSQSDSLPSPTDSATPTPTGGEECDPSSPRPSPTPTDSPAGEDPAATPSPTPRPTSSAPPRGKADARREPGAAPADDDLTGGPRLQAADTRSSSASAAPQPYDAPPPVVAPPPRATAQRPQPAAATITPPPVRDRMRPVPAPMIGRGASTPLLAARRGASTAPHLDVRAMRAPAHNPAATGCQARSPPLRRPAERSPPA